MCRPGESLGVAFVVSQCSLNSSATTTKTIKKKNEEKEEEKKGGGIQRVLFCVGGLGAKNAQRCKDVVRTVQQQYGNRTKTQQTLRLWARYVLT